MTIVPTKYLAEPLEPDGALSDAIARAFPEKTESGDSPALTNRIQASCWEEASMDGEAVFGGFA